MSDKDVEKYYKRFEAFVGAKTTETLIESFLTLATRAVGMFVRIKDVYALQNELKIKGLHHHQRAVCLGGRPCIEKWAAARGGQCGADHNKTYRFQSHTPFS